MTQPAADCNAGYAHLRALEPFFDAFSGSHLFRAVRGNEAKSFYGELWLFFPELQALNADGFSIYFTAHDPGSLAAKTDDFQSLRCVFQDAEPGKCPDPSAEPEIAGQKAHFVIETSPGRFQRFWLCEALPCDRWEVIHRRTVEWFGHDSECATGPAQIMRAPGFLNQKYDPAPLVRIVHDRSALPVLTAEAVSRSLAFPLDDQPREPNIHGAFQRLQSPGTAKNVIPLERERAKRGQTIDRSNAAERAKADIRETPASQLPLEDILAVMAKLSPSMGRNEWRKVGGALHFMSQGADWAFNLFETWSAGGDNFKGGLDCIGLWQGLSLDALRPTHWLTLQHMAAQVKLGPAEKERFRSPGFEALRRDLDPFLSVELLHLHYPELRVVEQGNRSSAIPERNSKLNTLAHYQQQGISVRHDDFADCARVDGEALSGKLLVSQWSIAYDHGWKPSQQDLRNQTEAIALDSRYNPAQEYFNNLAGKWDGVPRIATLFQRHLGAPDTPSIRELGALMMFAAIRRVYRPGYKFDLMPILAGPQGYGKSTFFSHLCPLPEWFLNSVRLDLEEKRLYGQIQGKLFVEFGELSGKKNAEIEKIKAFVTQQTDEYYPNFAVAKTVSQRIAVFVGTTNEHRVLRDLTGNRRFPIIPCSKELNWAELIAERDQLWAEAVAWEELTGDLRLSAEGVADMERLQQDRIDRDTTVEEIFDGLNAFETGFIHKNALWSALGFSNDRDRDKKLSPNAKYAMRDLETMLRHAGWTLGEKTKYVGGQGRGHFRKKGRQLVKEILYYGSCFVYKADLPEEERLLLDGAG